MTATEGLLGAQNGQNAGAVTGAGYAAVGNGGFKFNVSEIVLHFGREYYTMMSCEPERLHCFYSKQSSALHCNEEEMDATVCMGLEEIHERMVGMGYNGVRVVIANIDCQPSMNGAILIFVLGTMTWPTGVSRKFAQTFLLAEQPNGYFVLNDIMRILCTEEKAPLLGSKVPATIAHKTVVEPAVRQPPANAAAGEAAGAAAVPVAVPPAADPPKVAVASAEDGAAKTAAAKPAPSTTAGSGGKKGVNIIVKKQQDESKSSSSSATSSSPPADAPDKTTASSPSTEPASQLPSSWAKLAAVQKNRWGNGVVAESKGPVASIPVAPSSEGAASRKTAAGSGPANKGATPGGHQGERAAGRDRRVLGEGEVAKSVYVHEIKGRVERQALRKLFEQFGPIKSYDVVASKGIAFIEFESLEAQSAALKAPLTWNNEPLVVEARRAPQAKRDGPVRPGGEPVAPSRRTPQGRPSGNTKPQE